MSTVAERVGSLNRVEPASISQQRVLSSHEMSLTDALTLENTALSTLDQLVSPYGIRASSDKAEKGMYHAFFGRDTAITSLFILEAHLLNPNDPLIRDLARRSASAVYNLSRWMGQKDDVDTGEKIGKIPHEIRDREELYRHLVELRPDQIAEGKRPWFVDPQDNHMKNWDSVDATPLWIIAVSRFAEAGFISLDAEKLQKLRLAEIRLLKNLDYYGGLAGFQVDKERKFGGLVNKGWKDSEYAYLHTDGRYPLRPIKDVFVNALFWSALRYGESIFRRVDNDFSFSLGDAAHGLKTRFNREEDGFVVRGKRGEVYLAEGIDGHGEKLTHVAADPLLTLFGYYGDEIIIEDRHVEDIVQRAMQKDMFDPNVGIRTYSQEGTDFDPTGYHRHPDNFWPWVSGAASVGLRHLGRFDEAYDFSLGMLNGVRHFGTMIELMKKQGDSLVIHSESDGQESCVDQAWTAGAVLEATQYLKAS